jgi:four helix bundle protein
MVDGWRLAGNGPFACVDLESSMSSYRDLEVWQLSMELAERVFVSTKQFPRDERFGLTSQVRRSAASVPANLAEGQARAGRKEFLYSISVARGSLAETETHLELARRLGYLSQEVAEDLWDRSQRVGKMLLGLQRSLRAP